MIKDFVAALEDVRDNPLCDFAWGTWYTADRDTIIAACPLTQVAIKLGMKIEIDDQYPLYGTRGPEICAFIEQRLHISSSDTVWFFSRYDCGFSLETLIGLMKEEGF